MLRASPPPPGSCCNVLSALTLANTLHGYEAKASVFIVLSKQTEEHLTKVWEGRMPLVGGTLRKEWL